MVPGGWEEEQEIQANVTTPTLKNQEKYKTINVFPYFKVFIFCETLLLLLIVSHHSWFSF